MDVCFNTPLKSARTVGASSASSLRFTSPRTPRGPEQSLLANLQRQQQRHTGVSSPSFGDRFIPDRSAQDMSLSSFMLTAKENMTPLLTLCKRASPSRESSVATATASASPVPPPLPVFPGSPSDGYASGGRGRSPPIGSPFLSHVSSARRRGRNTPSASPSQPRVHRGGVDSISPGRAGSVPSTVSDAFVKLRLDSASPTRRAGAGGGWASGASMDEEDSAYGDEHAGGPGVGAAGSSAAASLKGGAVAGGRGSSYNLSAMDVEPYTHKLARTLFSDAPQTSVLGTASGGACENASGADSSPLSGTQDNFDSSLGVVYECNRTRNFTSKSFRVIAQTPERILDAADMVDDFYMNLVDWSSTDLLGVALRSVVYLWNAATCNITQLPVPPAVAEDGSSRSPNALVSGLNWAPDGRHLAIGHTDGAVDVWDVETQTVVRHWQQHTARVGSLAWTCGGGLLATGSKDATIRLEDLRDRQPLSAVMQGHSGEVCGLKWAPNRMHLASGGNDNQLLIWDRRLIRCEASASFSPRAYGTDAANEEEKDGGRRSATLTGLSGLGLLGGVRSTHQPVLRLNEHTAAVKAIAWNPVQGSLLVSGGGTDDKTLRFWNTLTGECTHAVDTQSQVCGVLWARDGTELVSSHGFSMNQLTIWKYPSLRRIADLTGHTSRVLHLCMSPDGEVVVSAAGDETIRFWRCFSPDPSARASNLHAAAAADGQPWMSPAAAGAKGGPLFGSPCTGSSNRWVAAATSTATALRMYYDPTSLSDDLALR